MLRPKDDKEQGYSVYCQIARKDITPSTCESTQGQEGCKGCAAPCRRCENCDQNIVMLPEAGLCETCMVSELDSEALFSEPEVPPKSVVICPALGRTLYAFGCKRLQGQAVCHGCSEISRRCEGCRKRSPFSSELGLCLTCCVLEYSNWQPPSARLKASFQWTLVAKNAQHPQPLPMEDLLRELTLRSRRGRGASIRLDEASGPLFTLGGKNPFRKKKSDH